jgi:hypothetical protein
LGKHLAAGDDAVENGEKSADHRDVKQVHELMRPCSLGRRLQPEERRPPGETAQL